MRYPDQCSQCGAPARTELIKDERIGLEEFRFCINPQCFFFDNAERKNLVKRAETSPVYRRYLDKLGRQAHQASQTERIRQSQSSARR